MKPSIEELRYAIETMDALSQGAFGGIETIAELAIDAFERADFQKNREAVVHVLALIRDKARDAMNDINIQAEGVGAHYRDAAMHRRMDAARQADESRKGARRVVSK